MILAFSDKQSAAQIMSAAAEEQSFSIDEAALASRLDIIRERGFDSRKSPIMHGVTDISFPVKGLDGHVVAALTIPFLQLIDGSQKVDANAARDLSEAAVARISDALGYRNA